MISDDERRAVARRLREVEGYAIPDRRVADHPITGEVIAAAVMYDLPDVKGLLGRLADLIEPSYKPDAEYEAWYNSLSHFGDERGGPSTILELIEEIVWAALTVDLGPNGNTDSTGVDEGRVYTDKLFTEWKCEALRLSGSIDRDALLALADEMDEAAKRRHAAGHRGIAMFDKERARRIREALGVPDERTTNVTTC